MTEKPACCDDCSRPYGEQYGFPDLIIPFDAWRRITPTEDDGGLLCPSCICKRLHDKGIKCSGAFLSGPIYSVTGNDMTLLRRIENIELAIEGRNNRWAGVRKLTEPKAMTHEIEAWAIFGPRRQRPHLDKIMASPAEAWGLLIDKIRHDLPQHAEHMPLTIASLRRVGWSCRKVQITWRKMRGAKP